jgi:pyrroline-5-carboxylate reductase
MARQLDSLRIGFIGGGAMGEALVTGVIGAGVPVASIRVADPDPARRKLVEESHGVGTVADASDLIEGSDLIVLAVKPGLVGPVLTSIAASKAATPLWVSIAAGISLDAMAAALPAGARIVRGMPNTPALVGAGAAAFVANAACQPEDRTAARALFESVGVVWEAPNEDLIDAVTGLSGSGPAYVFVLLDALSDAGVRMGLPRDAASLLATQTVLGAAQLAKESGRHPASLKDQVTSPGGTTIAGVERLEAAGFRAAIHDAVEAATLRSKELGS